MRRAGALLAAGVALGPLATGVRAAAAQTYVVVVSGVGGDSVYADRFLRWGLEVVEAAHQRMGVSGDRLVFLAERPERDRRISGPATKEQLRSVMAELAQRVEPEADVFLILFGHGSDRGDGARFNLVGPDVSAGELKDWLAPLRARHVVVVNAASASGGFVPVLAGPGRVVIAATESGFERNAPRFGEFWAAALSGRGLEGGESADRDKDGRLSVLEAFDYARGEVERLAQREHRLLTEHAVLEADGDGKGTRQPVATAGDGAVAAAVYVTPSGVPAAAANDPELRRLYARRDSLEQEVARLRSAKAGMPPEQYDRTLEHLLLELARTTRAIREREGKA